MSPAPSEVLQAAREIRPYLQNLLSPAEMNAVDQQLDQLLAQATDNEQQSREILDFLSRGELTREWMRLYLEERQPAAKILDIIRTYRPLPGKSGAIASPRYRCPVASCHQVWYRRQVEASIPDCPIHGIQMVRESKPEPTEQGDEKEQL